MNPLSRITASVGAVIRSVFGSHPASNRPAVIGTSRKTRAGAEMDHVSAIAIPAIFRAVSILSAAMMKVPFYVFKEEGEGTRTWDRKHPAWDVVQRRAHRNILAPQFRETMTAWALLYGNAVAKIDRSDPDRIELLPLLPDRTYPMRVTDSLARQTGADAGAIYYCTVIDGKYHAFEASTCLHIRGLGLSPYWGVDVVTCLIETLGGAAAAAEFGHRFWGEGANPAGFIEMPGALPEDAEDRFRESLKKTAEGLANAHKLALLEEGAKFHAWTVDPEKAQFLEGREFDIRLLAMVVGIKVSKLIDSANSSYNSLEMSNQEHREDDLMPWYCRWSMEYESKLLTECQQRTGSHSVGVDDESMEWIPFAERSTGCVELFNNGIITRDEARRRVNFGRAGVPMSDKYRIPSNITYEGQQAVITPPEPPPPPNENDDAQDDDENNEPSETE